MLTQTFRGAEGEGRTFYINDGFSCVFKTTGHRHKNYSGDIILDISRNHYVLKLNGNGFLSNIGLDWRNSEFE